MHYISNSVVCAIISLADQSDHRFRKACIQTMCEITVRDARKVASLGGLRVIIKALNDCPKNMADFLVLTVVHLLDSPNSRHFLRPHVDVEVNNIHLMILNIL